MNKKSMLLIVVAFIIMITFLLSACTKIGTDKGINIEPIQVEDNETKGQTEIFTFGQLKLEVTNVESIEEKITKDDGGYPWEYPVFICYPGSVATILDADMSDTSLSEDGKSYPSWGIMLVSDERIKITDDMDSFDINSDIIGVYSLESSMYVLEFEITSKNKVVLYK